MPLSERSCWPRCTMARNISARRCRRHTCVFCVCRSGTEHCWTGLRLKGQNEFSKAFSLNPYSSGDPKPWWSVKPARFPTLRPTPLQDITGSWRGTTGLMAYWRNICPSKYLPTQSENSLRETNHVHEHTHAYASVTKTRTHFKNKQVSFQEAYLCQWRILSLNWGAAWIQHTDGFSLTTVLLALH